MRKSKPKALKDKGEIFVNQALYLLEGQHHRINDLCDFLDSDKPTKKTLEICSTCLEWIKSRDRWIGWALNFGPEGKAKRECRQALRKEVEDEAEDEEVEELEKMLKKPVN